MKRYQRFLVVLGVFGALATPVLADLELKDTAGAHLDVVSGDKILVRYMYAHDTSTPEKHHETYKPYLHVFDAEGKNPITKGPGGKFTHHRGIFIGWNRIGFGGKNYDRWHMKGGDIIHREFSTKEAKGRDAAIVSLTQWMADQENPILHEERTMRVEERVKGAARMMIDFQSVLTAKDGDVSLKGDPEHAGIQYRPANEVDVKETVYVFPKEGMDPKKERDLPWVAESYTLHGKRHSVVHMNHPQNPKGTVHSAYRNYGRFGAYFEKEIPKGEELKVRYRILIIDGELPARDVIEKEWKAFAEAD